MAHFTLRPGGVALAPFVLALGLVATAAPVPGAGAFAAPLSKAASQPPTAATYAQRIVKRAPVAQEATEVDQSPDPELNQPNASNASGPGAYDGTILRARWWTVAEPRSTASQQIEAQTPPGMRNEGVGTERGGRKTIEFVQYQPRRIPSTVFQAVLEVDVVSMSQSQSAVGAFAVVVRQPKRPARETVPLSALRRARLVEAQTQGGAVVRRRTVHRADARALATAFNRMVVLPGGARTECPKQGPTSTTVTFLTAHHRWVVAPEWCTGLGVRRDGQKLPELVPTTRYEQAVTKDLRG